MKVILRIDDRHHLMRALTKPNVQPVWLIDRPIVEDRQPEVRVVYLIDDSPGYVDSFKVAPLTDNHDLEHVPGIIGAPNTPERLRKHILLMPGGKEDGETPLRGLVVVGTSSSSQPFGSRTRRNSASVGSQSRR